MFFFSIWKFEVLFRKVISYFEGNQTSGNCTSREPPALTWMIKFAEFKTALKIFKNFTFSQFQASEKSEKSPGMPYRLIKYVVQLDLA